MLFTALVCPHPSRNMAAPNGPFVLQGAQNRRRSPLRWLPEGFAPERDNLFLFLFRELVVNVFVIVGGKSDVVDDVVHQLPYHLVFVFEPLSAIFRRYPEIAIQSENKSFL